ncbi:asparaginase [Alteribacillus sp. HJP-4]|uniref:asparaginase n=1 Tax=Alteribacillus sp. HJP-4 TaxID=2775394 RepID=UPI0035CD16AC
MNNILVIHTGGTISMKENKTTGDVSPDTKNPLHEWEEIAAEFANISVHSFLHLPSPHITPAHMMDLFRFIEQCMADKPADGVVISHGTDTLEETAYMLDLLHHDEYPIVITGAMRSSNEISPDGPHNFVSSIRTAASDNARGMGVLVVMNDEIHTAEHVTKTHSSNIATFQSPPYGPVGLITKRGILFPRKPVKRDHFPVSKLSKKVLLIKCYAGMEEDSFRHFISQRFDGLVLEALGQGNVPPALLMPLKEVLDRGIPIVLVSRSFSGIVQDTYSYEGGGRRLKEMGIIFSNGLTGPKARLKLLAALSVNLDKYKLQHTFEQLQ